MRSSMFILIAILGWFLPAEDYILFDKAVQKKLNTAILNAFEATEYHLVNVQDSSTLVAAGEKACLGQTYQIYKAGMLLGYAHFNSGMGRYEPFDFVVLYDTDYIIRQVEILVYRSDHGFGITNKRWLSQFQGTHGCGLVYGKEIDAISGATLSGTSLTETIAEICETMKLNATFEMK